MKAREKLLITLSVIACGVSIAVFALVSLGHFIYTPSRTTIPVVGKMYESTIQQVALLEPVPVPKPPVTTPDSPSTPVDTTASDNQSTNASQALTKKQLKNQRTHKGSGRDLNYDELQQALADLMDQLLRYN